jgi:DMSO/TMAO reductase YedYZ molybdopterin-dependent catalytic subunit
VSNQTSTAGTDDWFATPLDALELAEIPSELHFVRSHFPVPETGDPEDWRLELCGNEPLLLSLQELRAMPAHTGGVVLECAGHRRTELDPLPPGLPWSCGAVAEARWTGASLAGVLRSVGIPPDAIEVVLEGADAGSFPGLTGTHHFARSLPLAKALQRDVLLAYEMNGEPIPARRGGPVRAIVPGWYATDSVKWLARVWFGSAPFEGPFQALDYRMRRPGEPGLGERLTELPVHGLITTPEDGAALHDQRVLVRGVAWGGSEGIERVQVCADRRAWRDALLTGPGDRYGRVRWECSLQLEPGHHELACRAVDGAGNVQPDWPAPNPGGYANHAVHRVHVRVSD